MTEESPAVPAARLAAVGELAASVAHELNHAFELASKLVSRSLPAIPPIVNGQDLRLRRHQRLNAERDSGRREHPRGLRLVPWPEQEFSGLLAAAPVALVIADRDGWIIWVNDQTEKLFGYRRGELLGRKVEILIPERFRGRHIGQGTAYFANPGTRPVGTGQQLYGLRKDGQEFPAEMSLSPLSAEYGIVIASAIRDVTEQRRMEEELRQRTQELEDADRHKDEFLGMLAHELRNPLGTIRNAVQVLKQLGPPDPNLEWARDVIARQADHMAHLVEDLLEVSGIAHGKISIRKETVELGQLVDQAVEICRPFLSARKQQLTVSLPPRPVPLLADPTRLVQVVTNLLNNAAKYTEDGGQIWLTAAEEESEVVVRVRDNGIGIAAEMLPRVFDLFTQAPAAVDRSEGGIGIGLAIVGRLVQLHGGTVQAFSDGPGRGSEFVVRLPHLSATCSNSPGPGGGQVSTVDVCGEVARTVELTDHHLSLKGVRVTPAFAPDVPSFRPTVSNCGRCSSTCSPTPPTPCPPVAGSPFA